MAVRQYVGARYVPKFADPVAWQANTAYEALTIVTYNNSSYTSKIPVPASVGNPADNATYWVCTGDYNAQVEDYRQTALAVEGQLNTIEQAQTEQGNTLDALSGNFYKAVGKGYQTKVVCIGDSYGRGQTDSTTTDLSISWPTLLQNITGFNVKNYCISGAGFTGLSESITFEKQLETAAQTDSDAQYVLIVGGSNDYTNPDGVFNAAVSALSYAKQHFTQARIIVIWATLSYMGAYANKQITRINYRNASINQNVVFYDVTPYIRFIPDACSTLDNVHLSAQGYLNLAMAIAKIMRNGYTDATWFTRQTIKLSERHGLDLFLSAEENIYKISQLSGYVGSIPAEGSHTLNGSFTAQMATMSNNTFKNIFTNPIPAIHSFGYVHNTDGNYLPCALDYSIENSILSVTPICFSGTSALTIDGNIDIIGSAFEFICDKSLA